MKEGEILAGKYQLVSRIGAGGMGEVWRAHHLVLHADVAVKLVLAEALQVDEVQQRFIREARAAAALRSPYVVQVLDYGLEQGVPFMVMELMDGESLADRLLRDSRIPPEFLAHIMRHVSRAVGKGHAAGIVHRDLKPDNIFLTYVDGDVVCKVLDFGIAKFQQPLGEVAATTRTGALMGTPYYMSPEQAEGRSAIDGRSDIWAMGVIAFECLTGQRPFECDGLGDLLMRIMVRPLPIPSQVAQVPPGFDEWFARCVNRDADQRFATAKEASATLSQVCGGPTAGDYDENTTMDNVVLIPDAQAGPPLVQTAQPVTQTVPGLKKGNKAGLLVALGAVGLVVFAGLAIGGVFALRASASPIPAASTEPENSAELAPSSEAPAEASAEAPSAESPASPDAAAVPEAEPSAAVASPEPAAPPTAKPTKARPAPKPTTAKPKPTADKPKKPSGPTSAEDMY